MKKHGLRTGHPQNEILVPPAYPFDGIQLFDDVRARLSNELRCKLGLRELARIVARSTSTTHFWFTACRHPHLVGFMTLLEHLSPCERHSFIESHCRTLPTLSDLKMSGDRERLPELLAKRNGLTILIGSTAAKRSFVLTAFGHSWCRLTGLHPAGIDIHLPQRWVPIMGVRYIDENLEVERIRALVQSVWGKIATSSAQLILLNGLLPVMPEAFNDLLRMSARQHVILSEPLLPEITRMHDQLLKTIHVLSITGARDVGGGVILKSRRGKRAQLT